MKYMLLVNIYLGNVMLSMGAIPWTIFTSLLRRISMLLFHVMTGPVYLVQGVLAGFKLLFNKPAQGKVWLRKGLFAVLAWMGRALSKILDVVLSGELLDLVFHISKPNSRRLSELELAEAKKVFEKGLTYWQIRIDECSLIARLGAWFVGSKNMGVTTFHTINFTRKLEVAPGNRDMKWLIHELAHVSQMERSGVQYIGEALVAQNTGGYHFGGANALIGKRLQDFNREQQAEIAAHYYQDVLYGTTPSKYYRYLIKEFRKPPGVFFSGI